MKKYFEMLKKITEISNAGGEIFIRCAGEVGQQLCFELKSLGIKVTAFLDNNTTKVNDYPDVPIYTPDVICKKERGTFFVLIAIKDDEIYEKIVQELKKYDLVAGIDFGDFALDAERRMRDFSDIRPSFDFRKLLDNSAKDRFKDMKEISPHFDLQIPNEYNLIPNLDIPLTTYCSMKCEFCSHCIPFANPPKHFVAEEIISDLDKLLQQSYIACVAIMGGEPFVYPKLSQFARLYRQLRNKKNIGFTRVVTNGTVLPPDDFFEEYKKIENAYIYISNYGEKSRKIEEIVEKCKEYGIKYYICPYSNEWMSLGSFSYKRDYTEEQLKHLYAVCGSHSCIQLLNGRVYSCGRTPLLNEDKLIPYCETDFCEIRNAEAADIKEHLHHYLYEKPYLEGCRYCDGQHIYSKRVNRGV